MRRTIFTIGDNGIRMERFACGRDSSLLSFSLLPHSPLFPRWQADRPLFPWYYSSIFVQFIVLFSDEGPK